MKNNIINAIKIIQDNDNMASIVLALYKAVIDVDWDDIEVFNSYPQCNKTTAEFILEKCHEKINDNWQVNSIWLNNGFSSNHNEVKDFIVQIPKDCFTMKVKSIDKITLDDITGSYAQVGVEELGDEPDYSYEKDPEKGIFGDNQINNSYL